MTKSSKFLIFLGIVILLAIASFMFLSATGGTARFPSVDSGYLLIQDEPELNLRGNQLERLSWGAVIAGTLITLVAMFVLNLLGVAFGFSQVNPEYGTESADASDVAIGGISWLAISNLIALFLGGWLAAYFAGIPEPMDGLLHGIMVWATSGIVTILLVMSGVGRVMSGLSGLISSGLNLTGSFASSASQVAGTAVQATGSAVGSAGSMTAQTLSLLAGGVQNSAQVINSGMSNMTDAAIENTPDVQDALSYQDLSFDTIKQQAKSLLRKAGTNPDRMEQQAKASVEDAKVALQHALKVPGNADRILDLTLRRVLRRGEAVASEIDRENLIQFLDEETDMSSDEIKQQIENWEQEFNSVKAQTRESRKIAKQKAEEFRQQAEQKAQEIYEQAQSRAEELQNEAQTQLQNAAEEAEVKAREAAQAATDTFSKVAIGISVAMLVGAIAAAAGGFFGAPEGLPDIPLDEASYSPNAIAVHVETMESGS